MKNELENSSPLSGKIMNLVKAIYEKVETLHDYLSAAEAMEILRRYMVMNSFDGALTMLGFIMGSYAAGGRDPHIILSAGISASLAMGLSGFIGALITEKAEREKKVKELEKALFADLRGSYIDKAARVTVISAAIVDALAPAVAALISALPLVFTLYGLISFDLAVALSITLTLAFIFMLGFYLGKVSGGQPWKYGLYMLAAGFILSLISNSIGFMR